MGVLLLVLEFPRIELPIVKKKFKIPIQRLGFSKGFQVICLRIQAYSAQNTMGMWLFGLEFTIREPGMVLNCLCNT